MVRVNERKPIDLSEKAQARFWSHVDKRGPGECWEWKLSRNPKGYGQFGGHLANGKQWMCLASRYAYFSHYGISGTPLLVLHSCDNPPCCNPAHLRLGTVQDNSDDMVCRERNERGSEHHQAKLTEQAVQVLETMWRSGLYTQAQLAEHFQVNQSQISRAINRRRWKHVDGRVPPKPPGKRVAQARIVTYRGETKRLTEFIKDLGLNWSAVNRRLRLGWTVDEALSTPLGQARKKRAA